MNVTQQNGTDTNLAPDAIPAVIPPRPAALFAPRPAEIVEAMGATRDQLTAMITQHPAARPVVTDTGVARVHRPFVDEIDAEQLVSHSTARQSTQPSRIARRWQQQSEHPSRSKSCRHHPAHVTTTSSARGTCQPQPQWQRPPGTVCLHRTVYRSAAGRAVCLGWTDPLAPKCPAIPPC
jgi:hypothetical protein